MESTYRLSVNRALLVLALFVLAGCAGAPGRIRSGVSSFDGANETALTPANVCSARYGQPCSVRLGLFRRSTMNPDSAILIVVVDASNPIAEGESLFFRVDGRMSTFTSIDGLTGYAIGRGPHTTGTDFCGPSSCSVKRYLVDRAFLKDLTGAHEASLRVLLKNGVMGGALSDDEPDLALPSIREFCARAFGS